MKPAQTQSPSTTHQEDLQTSIATLLEINAAIAKMDSSVRTRAFDLLCSLHLPERAGNTPRTRLANDPAPFVNRYRSDIPAENVYVLIAWAFLEHGQISLTLKQIRDLAAITATPIPDRPDNTMRYARQAGSPLFERCGGDWRLTQHGQCYFREKFPITG